MDAMLCRGITSSSVWEKARHLIVEGKVAFTAHIGGGMMVWRRGVISKSWPSTTATVPKLLTSTQLWSLTFTNPNFEIMTSLNSGLCSKQLSQTSRWCFQKHKGKALWLDDFSFISYLIKLIEIKIALLKFCEAKRCIRLRSQNLLESDTPKPNNLLHDTTGDNLSLRSWQSARDKEKFLPHFFLRPVSCIFCDCLTMLSSFEDRTGKEYLALQKCTHSLLCDLRKFPWTSHRIRWQNRGMQQFLWLHIVAWRSIVIEGKKSDTTWGLHVESCHSQWQYEEDLHPLHPNSPAQNFLVYQGNLEFPNLGRSKDHHNILHLMPIICKNIA